MDGDIFYAGGTPVVIEGLDGTIIKTEFIFFDSKNECCSPYSVCSVFPDGSYSINPDLTVEQYKHALEIFIEYFTKGKQ